MNTSPEAAVHVDFQILDGSGEKAAWSHDCGGNDEMIQRIQLVEKVIDGVDVENIQLMATGTWAQFSQCSGKLLTAGTADNDLGALLDRLLGGGQAKTRGTTDNDDLLIVQGGMFHVMTSPLCRYDLHICSWIGKVQV